MLASLDIFNSFPSDVYLDDIADMIFQFHLLRLDQYSIQQKMNQIANIYVIIIASLLQFIYIYIGLFVYIMLGIYFVWFSENIYQIMSYLDNNFQLFPINDTCYIYLGKLIFFIMGYVFILFCISHSLIKIKDIQLQ